MWSRLLVPHRRRPNLLPVAQLEALRSALLTSPYLSDTDLNEGFMGTRGFSVMVRRQSLDRLLAILPSLDPYLKRVLHRGTNALFVNPLVVPRGGVGPHCDKTLVSFTAPDDPPYPFRVSVLYLQVPPGSQGGELVFHRRHWQARVPPQENLLVEFPGWLLHEVTPFEGEQPRVSLVCEQYRLPAALLERLPSMYLDTTRAFQDFLDDAMALEG